MADTKLHPSKLLEIATIDPKNSHHIEHSHGLDGSYTTVSNTTTNGAATNVTPNHVPPGIRRGSIYEEAAQWGQ